MITKSFNAKASDIRYEILPPTKITTGYPYKITSITKTTGSNNLYGSLAGGRSISIKGKFSLSVTDNSPQNLIYFGESLADCPTKSEIEYICTVPAAIKESSVLITIRAE
jgi:hypothetical protein